MYTKLTIQERIRDLRQEKKLTLEQLADATGLSKSALGSYESNDTKDISHYAIIQLAKFYSVTTDYLLGVSEQKTADGTSMCPNPDNAEICGYLSGKKLNRRLLQELISHEEFPRLLADIEIYERTGGVPVVYTNSKEVKAVQRWRTRKIEICSYFRTMQWQLSTAFVSY